jgi:hypothetical protein
MLEWRSNPVNDMIADSLIAMLTAIQSSPGAAKAMAARQAPCSHSHGPAAQEQTENASESSLVTPPPPDAMVTEESVKVKLERLPASALLTDSYSADLTGGDAESESQQTKSRSPLWRATLAFLLSQNCSSVEFGVEEANGAEQELVTVVLDDHVASIQLSNLVSAFSSSFYLYKNNRSFVTFFFCLFLFIFCGFFAYNFEYRRRSRLRLRISDAGSKKCWRGLLMLPALCSTEVASNPGASCLSARFVFSTKIHFKVVIANSNNSHTHAHKHAYTHTRHTHAHSQKRTHADTHTRHTRIHTYTVQDQQQF